MWTGMPTSRMDGHLTLNVVALAGMCAGFTLFLTGDTPLAGVVTAASAYAVLVPELASDRPGATDVVSGRTDSERTEPRTEETARAGNDPIRGTETTQ